MSLAPDLFREVPDTNAVDVYSFAMILYETIVGRAVYAGLLDWQIMGRIMNQTRADISDGVQREVREIIEFGWSENPERPPFTEILTKLESIEYQITEGVDSSAVRAYVRSVQDGERDRH
jgi:hypothetical protein